MAGLLKYKFTKTKKTDGSENVAQIIQSPCTENTVSSVKQYVAEIPIIPDSKSEFPFPECWDFKQVTYFTKKYPWIYFKNKHIGCKICRDVNQKGSHVASEWSDGEVYPSGSTLEKKKTNLRKKISKHKNSAAHLNAQKVILLSEKKVIDEHISILMVTDQENTARIFRTAYLIAKNQRPYTDMPKLTDLQELNGLDMGRILQTNVSCSNIIDHLALEMRRKIAMDIVKNNRKICILVDESTTLSKKSMLVICLRCAVGELNEVYTFLFDIVEVSNTSAKTIKDSILQVLEKYGMDTDFLKKHFISFVSDGASNMLGRKAGVGVLLQKSFPHIILWHCCNHRLEFAVADCFKEVSGINYFQSFIEKLYSLYHMSPKNMNELK